MAATATVGSLIGTALIGAAGSAGASIYATNRSNAANMQMANMSNAYNSQMLDKQIRYNKEAYKQQVSDQWDFYNDEKQNSWNMYNDQKDNAWRMYEDTKQNQWDMFNATNEYNDPSNARARLEAAGFNPYLFMDGGSAGVATSVAGSSGEVPSGSSPSSSVPGMQGISPSQAVTPVQDYSGIAHGIESAFSYLAGLPDRMVGLEQANNLRIESKYKAGKMLAEIYSMRENAKTNRERLALDKVIASFSNDLKASQASLNREQVEEVRARTRLSAIDALTRSEELKWLPEMKRAELGSMAADIALKKSQKQLTDKQARHEIEKLAETVARTSLTNQQYWTESANTVNAQLENTRRQTENQFNSDTYKNRVRMVEESLYDVIYNMDSAGVMKTLSKSLRSGEQYIKRLYNDYIK